MVQWRPFAALMAMLGGVAGLVLLSRQSAPAVLSYVLLLSATAAATTAMLWNQSIASARLIFAGAAVAHTFTLFGAPAFEDDYFRFIWDGWRTLQSGTPYGVAPARFFAADAVPPPLQVVLNGVNNPEYPTIYGPVLQVAFAAAFGLFGTDPLGLQLLFAGTNLLLIALLLRRYTPGQVALYAWNPLVLVETSLHLHPDVLLAAALFAALLAGRARPIVVGLLLGVAAGVKLVALAAWPLLLRLRPAALLAAGGSLALLYLAFLVQGKGAGFDSTAAFAAQWYFNPLLYEPLFLFFGWPAGRIVAIGLAGLLVVWLHARSRSPDDVPLAAIFGAILLFAPAVNSWYLLWLLPFAVGRHQLWPFAATVAMPFSYLTGLNLDDPALEAFAVHPLARIALWSILALALLFDWQRRRHHPSRAETGVAADLTAANIAVIMPALNEEAAVGAAVTGVRQALQDRLHQIIVVDNGSTDGTAAAARAAGAVVVAEPERGYGAACLAGIAALNKDVAIILFMDSDGSDVPEDAAKIVAPIVAGEADLVIGSRALGRVERGAMTVPQRFGNWLAPLLVRLIWGVRYTDLGPFRAIRRDSLTALTMQDRDFGWTIEMQVRAAKQQLRTKEVPTGYRRRVGVSKISGTVDGVLKAGSKILYVIGREALGDFDSGHAQRPLVPQILAPR